MHFCWCSLWVFQTNLPPAAALFISQKSLTLLKCGRNLIYSLQQDCGNFSFQFSQSKYIKKMWWYGIPTIPALCAHICYFWFCLQFLNQEIAELNNNLWTFLKKKAAFYIFRIPFPEIVKNKCISLLIIPFLRQIMVLRWKWFAVRPKNCLKTRNTIKWIIYGKNICQNYWTRDETCELALY